MLLALLVRRLRELRRPRGRGAEGAAAPGGDGRPTAHATAATAASGTAGTRVPERLMAALRPPSAGVTDAPLIVQVIRFIVLVMVLVTVPLARPHPGDGPQGLAIAVALGASGVAWAVWLTAGRRPRLWVGTLIVMAAAGGALAGLSSLSSAVAVGFVVTASAGARLSTETSMAITAETVASMLIAGLAIGAPAEALVGWSAGFIGMWAFGLTRRAYLLRAVDAERALDQARQAQEARAQTAALAERARIAREIHDVLAHSLAAVSVNLQAAEGLLTALPAGDPELAKAIECVGRAEALTREGMAEARRAVHALRGESGDGAAGAGAGPPGPPSAEGLAQRLRSLTERHRAAGDAAVEFILAGDPHPFGAEASLTAYRTAQEALTNARKHAPGQPVTVTVAYSPAEMTVLITNRLPPEGAERPLASAGTGYGLTGLRERAALAGGTLTAGAGDGQWRVRLRIPRRAASQAVSKAVSKAIGKEASPG